MTTMSTTQPSVAPSSTAPSPSSMSETVSDTSTLLFGFLVSALSIFAIFMTSAVIWNRLVARRRAIDAMLAVNAPRESQRLYQPTMWEVWAMPCERPPPWLDVKPVAAQNCVCPASSLQSTQTEQAVSFWRHHILSRVPPEITYLFQKPIPHASSASRDTDMAQAELSDGSDLQISLLISMPRAQPTQQGNYEHRHTLHEMVFATTNILYHDPAPS